MRFPVCVSIGTKGRCKVRVGFLPTLCPKNTFWLVYENRPLSGPEALFLQGGDPNFLPALKQYTDKQIFDLGGNAFCGPILAALTLSMLAIYDWVC